MFAAVKPEMKLLVTLIFLSYVFANLTCDKKNLK